MSFNPLTIFMAFPGFPPVHRCLLCWGPWTGYTNPGESLEPTKTQFPIILAGILLFECQDSHPHLNGSHHCFHSQWGEIGPSRLLFAFLLQLSTLGWDALCPRGTISLYWLWKQQIQLFTFTLYFSKVRWENPQPESLWARDGNQSKL